MVKCKNCINGGMNMCCAICGTNPSTDNAIDCKDFELRPQSIPAEDRYGRKPDKVKSLARHLGEYLEYEHEDYDKGISFIDSYPDGSINFDIAALESVLKHALDAYESTQNVKIRIERV